MIYLSNRESLEAAFAQEHISMNVKSNYVVAENSQDCTEEKIAKIIQSVGFVPILSRNKITRNVVFTVVPYEIPEFFVVAKNVNKTARIPVKSQPIKSEFFVGDASADSQSSSSSQLSEPGNLSTSSFEALVKDESAGKAEENSSYFSREEIFKLLQDALFIESQEKMLKDLSLLANYMRRFSSTALSSGLLSSSNAGFLEILSQKMKDQDVIAEIGRKKISIQSYDAYCHSIPGPEYELNVEGLHQRLIESRKKIPLFLTLHEFDRTSPEARKTSLQKLSELQNPGDRIMTMLKTTPSLDIIVPQLESLYPGHAVSPYFDLASESRKLSIVMIPLEFISYKLSANAIAKLLKREGPYVAKGMISKPLYGVYLLQKEYNLKIINLEDFFVEQVKNELEQVGYTVNSYYHTSFTTGNAPTEEEGVEKVKQDLIYEAVTDTTRIRQWSLSDEKLWNNLKQKGIQLPSHFNASFLSDLRENGHKIFGSEILVIEGTKN